MITPKSNHVWVVEMLERGRWVATAGMARTRSHGRRHLDFAHDFNLKGHRFRLRKYVAAK